MGQVRRSARLGVTPQPRIHLLPDARQTDVGFLTPGPALAPEAALHTKTFGEPLIVLAKERGCPVPLLGNGPLPFLVSAAQCPEPQLGSRLMVSLRYGQQGVLLLLCSL